MDARRERTRTAILNAFVELLGEKSYAAITVADLLVRAGVGRTTFYAHFRSKDDVLAAQVAAICSHALEPTQAGGEVPQDPVAEVERILANLHDRENGLRAIVAGEGSERFADVLRHEIVARAKRNIPEHPSGPAGSMNREFLAHHIGASFVGMVRWWAWSNFASTPHELARDYLAAILPLFENTAGSGGE